ncbi:unnamed protein product, partial [Polarella glacialis]
MATTQDDTGGGLLVDIQAWDDVVAVRGRKDLTLDEFDLGRTIGKGRFARVRIATLRGVHKVPICLKVLKKTAVLELEQAEHIINEKNVLTSVKHPFIIRMLETFQDTQKLYMALELVNGGELFNLLRAQKKFKEPQARFYIAEVVSAISYLHSMLIVFRDVKPENILIHRSGHLKLTDFGFAKYLKAMSYNGTVKSFSSHKGFGFLVSTEAEGDIYFQRRDLPVELQDVVGEELFNLQGRSVTFELTTTQDGKPQARSVQVLASEGDRAVGVVKTFSEKNGYGFLSSPMVDGDVYFQKRDMPYMFQNSEMRGLKVTFGINTMKDGKTQ